MRTALKVLLFVTFPLWGLVLMLADMWSILSDEVDAEWPPRNRKDSP